MKITFLNKNRQQDPDQWIPGLGYIQRNGSNFLPAIVRLEELLSGREKRELESRLGYLVNRFDRTYSYA